MILIENLNHIFHNICFITLKPSNYFFFQDNDLIEFRRMTRMDFETYDYLLLLIVEDIRKQDTAMRKAIPPSARLAVTLRYLAHG